MRYFIANLALHGVITIIFIVLACIFATRNRKHKTKHVFTYFFPIVFALVAVVDIVVYIAPRLLDINCLTSNNYYYDTGTVENIGFLKNYFVIDGKYYYLNPLRNTLVEGDTVRVKHTQYSSYTVEWTLITDADQEEETDTASETEN